MATVVISQAENISLHKPCLDCCRNLRHWHRGIGRAVLHVSWIWSICRDAVLGKWLDRHRKATRENVHKCTVRHDLEAMPCETVTKNRQSFIATGTISVVLLQLLLSSTVKMHREARPNVENPTAHNNYGEQRVWETKVLQWGPGLSPSRGTGARPLEAVKFVAQT